MMKSRLSMMMLVLTGMILAGGQAAPGAGATPPGRKAPTFDEETEEDKIPSMKDLRTNQEALTFVDKCVLQTTPNYTPCTDADDATQLLDGATAGAAWNNAGTVGWDFSKLDEKKVTLTISMKRLAFVTGLRIHIGCGRWAGVSLPGRIWASVSVDGKQWQQPSEYFPNEPTEGDEQGRPIARDDERMRADSTDP